MSPAALDNRSLKRLRKWPIASHRTGRWITTGRPRTPASTHPKAMTHITVTRAQKSDHAFIVASNQAMALATEGKSLDYEVVSHGVAAVFTEADRGFYLIAKHKGEPAGCTMVTYEWSDWRNGNFWWIQSVYVRPDLRRRGIYRMMYECVQRMAAAEPDVCGFRLYVEKENRPAQKTYAALGMAETDYKLFESVVFRA